MRVTSISAPSRFGGITNTGYSRKLAYPKQAQNQSASQSNDIYMRLAAASTKDVKIFNELKSMGLI